MLVIGIDPGLRDTGIVTLEFEKDARKLLVDYTVIEMAYDTNGKPEIYDATDRVVEWIERNEGWHNVEHVFIEKYIDRGTSYVTNEGMRRFESELRAQVTGANAGDAPVFVDNTGSKKVIRPRLLKLLGVHKFATSSNHQDLEAAARIAVFGMLKDVALNEILVDVVRDHVNGAPWRVTVLR